MQTIANTRITQDTLTVAQAREAGLLGTCWTERMAEEQPDAVIYEYAFDGVVGGHAWGEQADFTSLAEFADCAQDTIDRVWYDYQNEAEDFLLARGIYTF